VHTTPIADRPIVEGPAVSGFVHERHLEEVPHRLIEFSVRKNIMSEAGAHGPEDEEKRSLKLETLLLAEENGQVVGAVVADGVRVTSEGGPDFVLVNNGFGQTFKLVVAGERAQDRRLGRATLEEHAP
jgi:hypothetical protein